MKMNHQEWLDRNVATAFDFAFFFFGIIPVYLFTCLVKAEVLKSIVLHWVEVDRVEMESAGYRSKPHQF